MALIVISLLLIHNTQQLFPLGNVQWSFGPFRALGKGCYRPTIMIHGAVSTIRQIWLLKKYPKKTYIQTPSVYNGQTKELIEKKQWLSVYHGSMSSTNHKWNRGEKIHHAPKTPLLPQNFSGSGSRESNSIPVVPHKAVAEVSRIGNV